MSKYRTITCNTLQECIATLTGLGCQVTQAKIDQIISIGSYIYLYTMVRLELDFNQKKEKK